MVINIKDNGKMIKCMVKANLHILMEIIMMANGKMM